MSTNAYFKILFNLHLNVCIIIYYCLQIQSEKYIFNKGMIRTFVRLMQFERERERRQNHNAR